MVLHNDGFIELTYNVASDILMVRWPNVRAATKSELLYSFEKLVEVVRGYDIKKLLFNSRSNHLAVTDEEYQQLNDQLAQDLLKTRLQKVARLGNGNTTRETIIRKLSEEALEETHSSLIFRMFSVYDEEQTALEWLRQE